MSKPIVFLGPSLPIAEARTLLEADYRPPAGQGDLYRAAQEAPPAIALVDGIFKDAPTVRHREILWTLHQGIPVYGAASMGALRAAELHRQGMIGSGLIYRWFRRFPMLPDDAVAVTHLPRELGSAPLSDALVDLRRSLSAARRSGALTLSEAGEQARALTALSFPDRKLPTRLSEHRVPQKANDARHLLRLLARTAATQAWPRPRPPQPPLVHAWLDDLAESDLPFPDCL